MRPILLFFGHVPSRFSCAACVLLFLCLATCAAQAQVVDQPVADTNAPPEIGPHNQRLLTVTTGYDEAGNPITETNSIVQLQAGLNVWSTNEQAWVPASDEIELLNGGVDGAIARKAQHQVLFPVSLTDTNSGIIVQMPDGKEMHTRVIGLAITEGSNPARSLMLAEVQNSVGAVVGRNQIVYESALGRLGDIRYTVGLGSFEQDVVLREKFVPEDVGFNSATARIEIWTEIVEADAPTLSTRGGRQEVNFGSMRLGFGKAFKLSADGEAVIEETTDVSREWTTVDGRTFIIEAVPFQKLEPFLAVLPVRTASLDRKQIEELLANISSDTRRRPVSLAAMNPAPLTATNGTLVASVGRGVKKAGTGVVIDWTLLSVGSLTNYVFKGDETYYHGGGIINLVGSNVVFEAGVVLKWTNSASATLTVSSTTPVDWRGSEYRPVILCPKDENTWGQAIPGSTGDPGTNLYGGGLVINSDNNVISNVRIVSAHAGLTYITHNGNPLTVRNAQFVRCRNPIIAELATLTLNNALFTSCYRMLEGDEVFVQAEHLTVDGCDTLVWGGAGGTDSYLYLTNSILYALTNWGNYQYITTNQVVSPTNGAVVFKTVGAGSHYLADDTYRGIGTTNVSILADMRKRTTHPPVVLTNDFTASTNLFPQVPRDTNALPALGYHYDVLDVCWSGLIVTNATVTLTNGIAVGWYGSQGTILKNAGKLISEGTPLNFNRYVRYTTVQEQPLIWGTNSTTLSAVTLLGSLTTAPELRFRFTDVSQLADTLNRRRFFYQDAARCTLSMQDSWLRGAYVHLWNQNGSETMKLSLTNNLVQRSYLDMIATYVGSTYPLHLYWYNNVFQGGTNSLTYGDYTAEWVIKDNLFDGVVSSITEENYPDYTIPASNNGYRGSTSLGGSGNKTLTVSDYQNGPLGGYYYPTSGTSNLFSLVNAGSRNATNAGLYHFTVHTNQVKETNSTVDAGYHYVSVVITNWALNQTATQSSTYENFYNPIASKGVDGNTNGDFTSASVTHTYEDNTAWWHVDLGAVREIDFINVWNRTDCCGERLSNFYVFVSDTPFQSTNVTTTLNQLGVSSHYFSGAAAVSNRFAINRTGQFVRVQLSGTNYLMLAEVEVMSPWLPTDGDGDGAPDYLEDRDGDGNVDSGERSFTDPGPAVTITDPFNGQVFAVPSTNIAITAIATDNGSVTNVEFYSGTTLLGNDTTSSYSITWSNVVAGTYILTAKAFDNLGQTRISGPVTIIVNAMPSVSLTNPATNAYFIVSPTNILLEATASDSDGSITNVAFYNGTNSLGQDASAPYSLVWSNVNGGNYSLTARVSDNRGAVSTSSVVNITVNSGLDLGTTTNYVTFSNNTNLQLRTFTLECWFKQMAAGVTVGTDDITAVPLITKGRTENENGVTNMNYFLGITSGGLLAADFEDVTGGNHSVTGITTITNGVWYHAAAAFNGTNLQLYLNGNLEGTVAAPNLPAHNSMQHAALATALNTAGVTNGFFRGVLDEVRIWSYGRSQQQIRDDMSAVVLFQDCGLVARWGLDEAQGSSITNTATTNVITGTITGSGWNWTNSAPYKAAGAVLFVVGSTDAGSMSSSGDSAINTHLQSLGYFVTLKAAASAVSSDANSKSFVLISSSVAATDVNTKFTSNAVPVITWRHDLYDDLGMVSSSSYYGTVASQTQLIVVNPAHPLAGGFSGTVTVASNSSTFAWGAPNNNAVKIATTSGNSTNYAIFGYEKGATMPGLVAPARRVGLFMSDPSSMTNLNADGFALFDAALDWAITPPCPPLLELMFVLDYSASMLSNSPYGGTLLSAEKNAALYIATNLNLSLDRAGVVAFVGTDASTMLKQELTHTLSNITSAITDLTSPGNVTRIDLGINTAQSQFTTNHIVGAQPVIMLFSDGLPNSSSTNATYAAAGLAKQLGARLISVGLGTNVFERLMKDMASTPCDYYWEPQTNTLATILADLTNSLCRLTTNQQPNVAMVAPTNGQFFVNAPTNIFLAATASDPDIGGWITSVTFYSGTNDLGAGTYNTASNRYEFVWEGVPAGTNVLSARATDNLNAVGSSASVTIVVNGSPTIVLLTPTNNPSFTANATVPLSAYAVDSGGSITNVEVFQGTGTSPVLTLTNIGANVFSNKWTGVINGTYAVYARATDTNGGTAYSQIEAFTVNTNLTFPTVTINSPTNGQAFKAWANININTTVTPTNQISLVEFYAGTNFLGSDTNLPFTISRNGWQPGDYVLTAKATHNNGTRATSDPVTIAVKQPEPTGNGYWDPVFGSSLNNQDPSINEYCLEVSPDGNVYSGTATPGSGPWLRVTKWTNCAWSTPLNEEGNTYALKWHENGLYVGGVFSNSVGKLTGTNLATVGNGFGYTNSPAPYNSDKFGVRALQVIDGDLFVGGDFTSASNNTNAQFIARLYAASNSWVPFGNGLDNTVRAIVEFGDTVYVGGDFTSAALNTNIQYLAKWTGSTWTNVGSGVNGRVMALTAHNDRLFVGGDFTTAGGLTNANCIACWDGNTWSTINNSVSDGTFDDLWHSAEATNRVDAIAARGNELYVAGDFTKAWNGDTPVTANYVARAVWDETTKIWSWSGLDGGLSRHDQVTNNVRFAHAHTVAIRERSNAAGYDVIVAGSFMRAGGLPSYDLARWVVGVSECPTTGPSVQITDPDEGDIITGTNVTIIASASTNTVQVNFYRNGFLLGEITQSPWQLTTNDYTPGSYTVTAVATDSQTNSASSAPVNFTVKAATGPSATNDTFYVFSTGVATNLNVLANDVTSGGALRIVGVNKWANPFTTLRIGSVRIGYEATNLLYQVNPYSFGTNFISYDVADTNGTNTGHATIIVRALPTVQIATPPDGLRTANPLQTPLIVSGTTLDYDGTVSNVKLYTNNVQWGSQVTPTSSNTFSFSVSSLNVGFYTLTAVATDNQGHTNTSAPVDITVFSTVASDLPVAGISNLVTTITNHHGFESVVYPAIREGLFDLRGTAYDPDNTDDAYGVFLYRPDDPNEPFANVTPSLIAGQSFRVGAITNDSFGILDLTAIPNGIYDLVVWVRGGGEQTNAIVRVSLDTELKVGRFTFSEQDVVIPVNGIPLTVVRTYDSFNPVEGDFGFNWTYAINDMDVVIDEDRHVVPAITALDADDPLDKTGLDLDLRVGGGRNVTLTLPGGTRTTFRFTYGQTTSGEVCPGCVDAQWISAPGVFATLSTPVPATHTSIGDNSLIPLWGFGPVWQAGGLFTPMEAFDFPKFILTMQDGTKYEITRDLPGQSSPTYVYQDEVGYFGEQFVISYIQPHPNKPRVSKIEQRTGDIIVINPGDIAHYPPGSTSATRTVWFERDTKNRITAIHDPIGGSGGIPVVKYVYNEDTGNLIRVLKLVDRTAGSYATNAYHYDHAKFPHFITAIDDAIGNPITRNEYDDGGRLTKNIDANGNTITYVHNLTNKIEQIVDRLGKTNTFVYDSRGNVTTITNALSVVSAFAYDDLNNKTSEVIGGIQTNRFVFDTNSFLLQSVVGELQTNTFTYNPKGQVLTSVDGLGKTTTNSYDNNTDNLLSVVTALSTNTYLYDGLGRLISETDSLGTITTNKYDQFGNLTNVAVFSGTTELSRTAYTYDDSNNRKTQSVKRTLASQSPTDDVTTYVYDGQNRVVQTIEPDGKTNFVVYNLIGRQQATIDKLGRTNAYLYDARGNLTNVTYPDTTFERYVYDAEGRRTNTFDRAGRTNTSVFDSLGRLTATIFADNVSSNVTVYDAASRVFQTIDARGTITGFNYDAAGRRVAVTNAVGTVLTNITSFAYDAAGNQTNMVDSLNRTNSYFYDALNRRTNVTFQDGSKLVTQYDPLGRRIAETDQATNINKFAYDPLSRLTNVVNALSKTNSYQYDEVGNLTNQVDALNRSTKFEYDALGRRTKRIVPGAQAEWLVYDAVGNLIRHTNFNQIVVTNAYDSMNRLLSKSTTNGAVLVSYLYSKTGLRTNMTDASGSYGYIYDDRDRLRTNTTPQGTLHHSYDLNGNLTNLVSTTANGVSVGYEYDALNRLTNAIDNRLSGTKNTAYTFDGVGNLKTLKYPSGITNHWEYDSLNRLTNLTWKLTGSQRGDFTYKLGPAGNRTMLSDNVGGTIRTNTWGYDSLYRLTSEVVTNASPTGNLGYVYDDVGNRTSRTGTLGSLGAVNNTFDVNDWLDNDSVTNNANPYFDANGNTRTNGANIYLYDWANRLTNANSGAVVIVYDGDGNRVKKITSTSTNLYLVSTVNPTAYAQVVEESTVAGGGGATTLSRVYTYGLDLISQRQASSGTVHFFGYDGLGSTRFLLNNTGSIAESYAYDAFGTLIASNATPSTVYLYTGEQLDNDLGFYYLRARLMNPANGRFTTMDTFEGNREDPLSLHKYLYAGDDPVNSTDPSGNYTLTEITVGVGIVGIVAAGTTYAIKPARQSVFIALFTHGPLGRKLMRHYMSGQGTPIALTLDEMVEVGAVAPPSDSRPSILRMDDFDTLRQQLASGPVHVRDMRMSLVATEGATLGQFSAYVTGTLKGSPNDWSFEGTMRYHDFYNFEHHKDGYWLRNSLVFGVRSFVNGKSFTINSELAPVKQSSKDREIQWKGMGVQNSPAFYEN